MGSSVIPIPPEARFLHARGWFSFRTAETGPAIAWTEWDERHKQWAVTCLEPVMNLLDEREQTAVIRHELAHILLGHFSDTMMVGCQQPDRLIAGDVAVNWFMPGDIRLSIDKKLDDAMEASLREQDAPEEIIEHFLGRNASTEERKFRGMVDPVAVLIDIGFSGDVYVPAGAVHARLHELVEQEKASGGSGSESEYGEACGGLQGGIPEADRTRASALANILASQLKNADEDTLAAYGGHMAGDSAGNMVLKSPQAEAPLWVRAVQEFARSIVRMALTDKRSHNRPQPALRAMGYHTPTARPKWGSIPDTVCLLVDTSGSMLHLLSQVRPAVEYLQQHGLTVRLIAGDTRVTMNEELKAGMPFPDMVGGGGTSIIPLWEAAAEYDPRAIVAFTDGYVDRWPGSEYADIEHLWVCDIDSGVPFGKQVGTR